MRKRSEIVDEANTDEALGVMSKNIRMGVHNLLKSFGLSNHETAYIEISKELEKDLADLLKKHNVTIMQ